MADIQRLSTELTTDPLGRGYSTMTDQQAADSLNAVNRDVVADSLSGGTLFNAVVPSEFGALTADQKDNIRWITQIGGGSIDVRPGTNARSVILNAFGSGSTTVANIAAALTTTISRARELNLLGSSLEIGPVHVQQARAL